MKKLKLSLICILLIIVLVMSFVFIYNNTPHIKYKTIDDEYTLYKAYGNSSNYKIKKNGNLVIGKRAFYKHTNLKSLDFGNSSITEIKAKAFENCTSLETFTLPKSCMYISNNAFSYCSSLTSFNFEDDSKLKNIAGSMFFKCTSLKDVKIPSSVEEIDSYAFAYCTQIEEILIPRSCEYIYSYAFYQSGIKKITVPYDCQISELAFEGLSDYTVEYYN